MPTEKKNGFRYTRELKHIHFDHPLEALLFVWFVLLADNDTGVVKWGSHASISYATGMSKKTVHRYAKMLEKRGLVSCKMRSRTETNIYTILPYDLFMKFIEKCKAGKADFILAQSEHQRKQDAARQRRHRASVTDAQGVTIPGQRMLLRPRKKLLSRSERASVTVREGVCHGQRGRLSRTG